MHDEMKFYCFVIGHTVLPWRLSVAMAVKAGRAGNSVRVLGEPNAALRKVLLQRTDIGKGLVGSDLT